MPPQHTAWERRRPFAAAAARGAWEGVNAARGCPLPPHPHTRLAWSRLSGGIV